jgi:PEP-CTERM motif
MEGRFRSAQQAAATLLLAAASSAEAVVIDFNELAYDAPPAIMNLGSSIDADGFDLQAVFELVSNPPADFRVVSRDDAWQADPGFATILMTDYPVRVTLTRSDGGPFDFASIDLADSANVGVARKVSFTFNFSGGGSSTQDVVLDAVPGLETFVFDETNLDSVEMRGVEQFVGEFPWYQFDNLDVTPVPAPTTLLLLGAGLIGLGRRRQLRSG